MTLDLTTITTSFGLLDEETQAALKAHGGPWEAFTGDGWKLATKPNWYKNGTYRVAPEPEKYSTQSGDYSNETTQRGLLTTTFEYGKIMKIVWEADE